MIMSIIHPEKDELLFSWLSRLGMVNGGLDIMEFMSIYSESRYRADFYRKNPIRYDMDVFPEKLYDNLSIEDGLRDIYIDMTMLKGIGPLMTPESVSHQIGYMYNRYEGCLPALVPIVSSRIQELKSCPECRHEDIRNDLGSLPFHKSLFYYRRSHQMPGVTVCYKHGCALEKYSGIKGYEMEEKDFEALPVYDASRKYAQFAADFLQADLQCNIRDIKEAIRGQLKDKGYYNGPYLDENRLRADFISSGMYKLAGETQFRFSTYLTTYAPAAERTLAVLTFLFDDVKEIQDRLTNVIMPKREMAALSEDLSMVSSWRPDLIEVKHDCGIQFLTTPFRLKSGWGCPKCDAARSTDAKLRELIKAADGSYTVLEPFKGNDQPILIKHNACGCTSKMKPRSFLEEGSRCLCETTITFEQASKQVNEAGPFKLISFSRTEQDCTILHEECGQSFSVPYRRFVKHPGCPFCRKEARISPSSHQELLQKVSELVGNEYTVLSEYEGYLKNITIRHNTCGKVFSVRADHFLTGQRCKCINTSKRTVRDDVYDWLKEHYTEDSIIFLEDVNIPGISKAVLKTRMGDLSDMGKIKRLYPGIYCLPDRSFTPEEVVRAKYLIRSGHRIGYLTGRTFAHELGLCDVPERMSLDTNKESGQHGRSIITADIPLKVHGPRAEITDENWKQLQVLSFLNTWHKFVSVSEETVYEALRSYLRGMSRESFDEWIPLYPKWTGGMLDKLYRYDSD